MILKTLKVLVIAALAVIPALADSQLKVTSPGYGGAGYIMGGEYVSPYDARYKNSSGQISSVQVICNDILAATTLNQWFDVKAISFAELPARIAETRWGSTAADQAAAWRTYQEAAWLGLDLLGTINYSDPVALHENGLEAFAIWGLFDSSALNALNSADQQAVQDLINQAHAQTFAAGQFDDFVLFTPSPLCVSPCVPSSPQEFIARTPEPGVLAIWMLTLLTFAMSFVFLKRRIGFAFQS